MRFREWAIKNKWIIIIELVVIILTIFWGWYEAEYIIPNYNLSCMNLSCLGPGCQSPC
jgi:hypothetical protein